MKLAKTDKLGKQYYLTAKSFQTRLAHSVENWSLKVLGTAVAVSDDL